jgi:hypothetical protein
MYARIGWREAANGKDNCEFPSILSRKVTVGEFHEGYTLVAESACFSGRL